MDMTNTNASHNLQALVRQAKATANQVLNPLPLMQSRLLAVDSQSLLAGLQSRETVTGFHPFADSRYPLPDAENAAGDHKHEDRGTERGERILSEAVASNTATTQRTDHHSAEPQGIVLNQQFTQLVEQVFSQLGSESAIANSRGDYSHSNQQGGPGRGKGSAGSVARPGKTATDFNRQGARSTASHPSSLSQGLPRNVSDSVTADSEPPTAAGSSYPVFQQLETLVAFLETGYQSFPEVDKPDDEPGASRQNAKAPVEAPKSHLADLTRLLVKGNEIAGNSASVSGKGQNKANVHRLNSAAESAKPRENANSRHSSPRPGPGAAPAASATQHSNMPDLLRRNPNMESYEGTVADPLGFQSLSPTVTQRMADALNDYLQEQAERHGVDLT